MLSKKFKKKKKKWKNTSKNDIKEIIIKSYGLNTSWVQDVLPSFTPTTNSTDDNTQLELEYTY